MKTDLLYGFQLGPKVSKAIRADFDYQTDDEFENAQFFRYNGIWHCIDQFIRFGYPDPPRGDEENYHASNGYIRIRFDDDDAKIHVAGPPVYKTVFVSTGRKRR